MSMRLQKYMAMCGVASRRKSEALIMEGHVRVNQESVITPGYPVDPETDQIEVDVEIISCESHEYILVNKPIGVVSTSSDVHAEENVVDLVGSKKRLYTVGRLDKDTEGLLLLTNDGDLTFQLTHPKNQFPKTYLCLVKGHIQESEIDQLKKGVLIEHEGEEYLTQPAEVELVRIKRGASLLRITICEGKNRQVRKMCDAVGHRVIQLKRIALGELNDSKLKAGQWRHLTEKELTYLKSV